MVRSAGGVQNQRTLAGCYRRTASLRTATYRYVDIACRRPASGRIHRHSPLNSYRLSRRRRIGIVRGNRRRGIGLIHGVRRGRRRSAAVVIGVARVCGCKTLSTGGSERDVTLSGRHCRDALVGSVTDRDIAGKRRTQRARRIYSDGPRHCHRLAHYGRIRVVGVDRSRRVGFTNRHRVGGRRVVALVAFSDDVVRIDLRDTAAGTRILIAARSLRCRTEYDVEAARADV